jgi:hypothetical protein
MEKYFACLLIADATGGYDLVPPKKNGRRLPGGRLDFF